LHQHGKLFRIFLNFEFISHLSQSHYYYFISFDVTNFKYDNISLSFGVRSHYEGGLYLSYNNEMYISEKPCPGIRFAVNQTVLISAPKANHKRKTGEQTQT